MTGLVTRGRHPAPSALLPVALALRQMALVQDELPKYLLAPEVSALLHYVSDLHRRMLLSTLWNSGARINEALGLTRADFNLASPPRLCNWPHLNSTRKKSPGRQHESQDCSPVRQPLRQPAGDDGGHAEDPAGAEK